jgi:hypothetical protein
MRLFKMSLIAQQALWSQTSGAPSLPVFFYVEGDSDSGYTIHNVNEEMCGFPLLTDGKRIRTLYCVKRIIEQINEHGTKTDYNHFFAVGTFAWANHERPKTAPGVALSLKLGVITAPHAMCYETGKAIKKGAYAYQDATTKNTYSLQSETVKNFLLCDNIKDEEPCREAAPFIFNTLPQIRGNVAGLQEPW